MPIVNLKHYRDQKVSELLNIFKLPCVDYSKGYQVKPGPEAVVVGGSAVNSKINNVEATRLHAVNELRRWIRLSTS